MDADHTPQPDIAEGVLDTCTLMKMGEAVQQAMIDTLKLMEGGVVLPSNELVSDAQPSLAAYETPLLNTVEAASVEAHVHTETLPHTAASVEPPVHIEINMQTTTPLATPRANAQIILQTDTPMRGGTHTINLDDPNHIGDNVSVEEFLDSIQAPIQQPILAINQQTNIDQDDEEPLEPTTAQRKSIRLAKKAEQNASKDTIQMAQQLLVKKLGDLAGENSDEEEPEFEPDFDFYAQHFQRPLELHQMKAI